jgi:hypothetical protein
MRWPASQTTSPALDTTPRRLRLSSIASRRLRNSHDGPLWMEDAHLVDGRWVVPGAVEVYTSRGDRLLEMDPKPVGALSFLVPLPAYPGKAQLAWSEWMPRARKGSPPLPDGFTMRFKVLPRSQPVRTQTFGPFEVATVAQGFYDHSTVGTARAVAASATFQIRHRGAPVVITGKSDGADGAEQRFDRAESVALLPGAPDALLVRAATKDESGPMYLIIADGDRVRSEYVSPASQQQPDAPLVTNDNARFRQARDAKPVPGTVDRETFVRPGVFLFDGALLTTEPPSVHRFTQPADLRLDPNVRPLGLSPDGQRFVRVGYDTDYKSSALVVTDAVTGATSNVPIDAARTRIGEVSELDPEWLQHYYAWARDADGLHHLEARPSVVPLPYRGVHKLDSGGYREYQLKPAGKAMFDAFTAWLATEMKAVRTPEDAAAFGYQVHVDGQVVHVFNNEDYHHVGVFMERDTDTRLVETIGQRFDAALATGRYDGLFTPK